jgi:hypothetical protein
MKLEWKNPYILGRILGVLSISYILSILAKIIVHLPITEKNKNIPNKYVHLPITETKTKWGERDRSRREGGGVCSKTQWLHSLGEAERVASEWI